MRQLGIARAHLIKACGELGIKVDESPFYLEEMMEASEVIISSSTAPLRVCNAIDGKAVGGGSPDIIERLKDWVINDYRKQTDI